VYGKEKGMLFTDHIKGYWRIGLFFMVLVFTVSLLSLVGCGKTEKGEGAKKAEAPAPPKVFVDDGKPLNFRGITMGVPLKDQFKDCKSAEKPAAGGCYKDGVKGEAFKQYQIEGLPKLDFATSEYVSLVDDKVELILVEFNKEYAGKNMMALVKGQFGEPASYKSNMLAEKASDIPYEKFLATWSIKGCVLELSNIRDSLVDSGRLLIKSDKYLKKEVPGTGKK
jgi:hypothetical protein